MISGQRLRTYFMFVHKKISSLKVSMNDIVLMQIIHSFRDVKCHFEQRLNFKNAFVFVKKIINAPPSHELWYKRLRLADHEYI